MESYVEEESSKACLNEEDAWDKKRWRQGVSSGHESQLLTLMSDDDGNWRNYDIVYVLTKILWITI